MRGDVLRSPAARSASVSSAGGRVRRGDGVVSALRFDTQVKVARAEARGKRGATGQPASKGARTGGARKGLRPRQS
jgi:hypothetical protein